MPAPLRNVNVRDTGTGTPAKPTPQPQQNTVKPVSPKKLQAEQWAEQRSLAGTPQPTQSAPTLPKKRNLVAQGLVNGTIKPPTTVKPISPKKLVEDQRREQRALTTGKPLVETPQIEAPRNETPQTSSVVPPVPGVRKPGLPTRSVNEIYRSATDGALNQGLETVLPTRRNIAINNAQNDLVRMERELIKPLWAQYEAAKKALEDGTGTEDALRSAERAYRNAEAQYTPYYEAFNRLLHSDANEYFNNGDLEEMGTRLDNWDNLIEEGNNALLLAENKVNGLQSAYDSASETLNQRAADLDAAYKALQIAEKAYKGNRNNKSKLSKYQSTWDQFQTALKAFNDSRDALLTADYNLSGAVGEYKAQMLMLGDLSNLRKSGGDTYYKRYIEAHPEVVWGQGIGAQYDNEGYMVGHAATLPEIQDRMDQLQADNADGHNTEEIKYYQNVLNSGLAIKTMDSGDFGAARDYYNGVAEEAQRAMDAIATRYMEAATPDVMAQASDLTGFKRIEQDLEQDPEYLAAKVKKTNAQYWLQQIQEREYDLTYERVFSELPDYADDQLNSLIKAYAEDSGTQHTALTSRQAVLRTTLASNGFSEDDINAVFDYAKYKGDAIRQDEVRERWYDWAIGLGKKFAGVDNAAAEGQYAAQFGGAIPEAARQALERARELSGSDDPGVIAATAASWPVAMVNSLASGTGAIDLATQGLANMTGIHKQDPFLGKFAPLNYNTIWQTPYTVSQALGEAQYKRTFDALYGRLGDAEQAEKKAQMYQNWYNLSQSMGQSTVIALMSMAGVPGSLMLLSGSAATQTMQDLHKQGYSDGYAVIGGIVSGFAEYITEEVSIEALMKTASLGARGITGRALWGQLALNLGGQIISEGSEEGASDIVNLIADEFGMRLLNGGFSQIEMDALAKTREDPSLSYEDALRASWIDWAKQTGQDIMYGGISGGLMGMGGYAVGEAVGSIRQGLRGSELRANGSLGLIMDQVMGMDEVIARGLRLDPNTAFSNDVQIGRTAQRMRESVVLEGIRDRLEALGEEDITADLLSGINALAADERLTPAESKAIQRSKYGAQVSNELADYVEKRNAERAGVEDNRSTAEWTQGLEQQQESMDAMLNSPESSYAFNVNRVNRLEQQYEKLKAGNPDASILNPISDAITKAGADANVAKRQGQLMAKILSGENLTAKEMKEFDLNNQAVRKVFIERTGLSGMERLTNIAPKLKQAYVNRVVAESKMVQDMQAELGKSNDMLAELQQEKSAKRAAALQRTVQKNVFKDIFETRTRKENNAARAETAQQAMETAASERFTPDMTEQQVADKILQLTGKFVYTRSQFTVAAAASFASRGQLVDNRLSTSQEAAVATAYHNYLVAQGLSAEQIRALEDAKNPVQEAKAGEVVLADGMNPLEFNARQRASYEAIQQVAKALDLKIYLYETTNMADEKADPDAWRPMALAPDGAITSDNGWYDPNDDTIHLDINAGMKGQQVSLFAGAHEITHWFKKHNAEKFEALKNFLFEKYRTLDGGVTLENLINDQIAKAQQQGRTISREVAEEEVVADACETMLTDADVLQTLEELRNTDQTVWEKIVEIIRNIAEKIRAAYEGVGPNTREAKILNEIDGAFDELKTLWAEGVSEAAQRLNEMAPKDLDGNPGPIQHSIRSMVEGSGLTYRESDGAILDENGKEVKHVTPEQMVSTPLGRLVQDAVEFGTLSEKDAKTQYEFLAELMNQIVETRDAALIWETAGSFMFSAIKANSDTQYGKTIDFTTICKKTQQMVDVMSGAMLELGRGLTRAEVEMAYRKVVEAGEPVPCPVCYVFSRWIGIGGILNDMKQFQDRYAGMAEAELQAFMTGMRERAEAYAEEKIKNAKNPEKKRGDFYDKNGEFKLGAVMSDMKAGPNNRIRSRQEKINLSLDCALQIEALRAEAEEAARLGVPFKFTEQNTKAIENLQEKVLSETELQRLEREIAELEAELEPIKAYQYLNGTIMLQNKDGSWYKNPDFKPVPDNLLFNLNAGAELAANYPFSWKYRTTRGCSAGKAMLPYSDARVGETIQGVKYNDVKDIYTNAEDNPFLNGDETDRRKVLLEARAKQRLQNLIGGMRYQSTSDFRFEYGSDYLITFMEMQAIGANVQLYTKVIEAVDFLATMGADCNLSVMPLGNGYVENADGTRTLVFSPVTGINGDAAIEMSRRYDNVQLILVGISDEHIRTALAGTDVTFVIPFHGSGNTVSNIQTLMDAVNEELDITTAKDYSAVQTDHERKDGTKEEQAHWKAMRKLRLDIIMGKAQNLSAAQQALLDENQYLADLWNRFYVEGVDPKTYKCFLAKNQAEQIFPYEYWDKNSTYDNADVNGNRFQEYCALMGIVPRFSGLDSDGNDLGYGNFTKDKGYWKLLIDRSMYTNVYDKDGNWIGYGKYRDQSPINCTNMKVETLDPKWAQATYGEVMTAANDPGKTNEIVRNVIDEITREVREGERVDVMHSAREELTHDISGVTQGLNFRDPTGELLDRVFDGSKKYETRRYTINKGNGKLAGAFLNKPMGIVQTGAGRAQLVGFWELGDGQLRDYNWLKEHAAELGNDGTEFEAKPGEKKWVYPIKWAERTDPAPVTGGNQVVRNISDIVANMNETEKPAEEVINELKDHDFVTPETGESVRYSVRENQSNWKPLLNEDGTPKLVYKAFYAMDGKLYPPMISNMSDSEKKKIKNAASGTLSGLDTPVGVVLDAEVGELARYKSDASEYDVQFRKLWKGSSKAIKQIKAELKAEGYNVKTGLTAEARAAAEAKMEAAFPQLRNASRENLAERQGDLVRNESKRLAVVNSKGGGTLAFRPGWHLGEWPNLRQFDVNDPITGKERSAMPDSLVFCACEIAGDIDYQLQAMELGVTANGGFDRTQAGLPYVPVDGFYKYRTNADPTTEPWYITGAIKVVEILDDEDCRRICAQYGITPQPRVSHKDINLADYGLKRGPVTALSDQDLSAYKKSQAAIRNEAALQEALSDPNYQDAYVSRKINFNDKEIQAEFARNYQDAEYYRQKYEEMGDPETRRSAREVQSVEDAAKALDEKFGKGTAKNLASLARRFEQRAEAAQKQLELERAQHKAQTKQLKKDLMEAKKVAGKIERASGKALRAANNELNKERRENQRRETELKKKMADLATDSMWARKIAESNGEQLLKEQRRLMQDKFDYATRTDIQWGRRWKQSAVTNARQEERRIARDKLGLQRQILSLPGRAAASEARRFRNKKNRVMMNDDTSVLSPIFRQESDPKIPRNAAQFGRRMQRIQEGFEDVPDKIYRAMVNDVNELDKMAKLETRTDNLSVQVNIVRASGATLETIYRTALVDKSGNVIGDSMENIFLCHDENGKFDEKLQKSLEEYMFHKHNVDRMSLEERAVLRVREFTAAPNRHWLVELSAAELAREAADGNPIVQEYVALLRWANNVKNKAVLPGADNYALSADQSQLVVEQYENDPDMKWVVDKANQIYQWWDQFMRNWAVGASISEESYADMRELYPHYVPTYRVDEGGHAAAVRANPSSLETGEMTKAAKGSTRPLIRLEDQFVRSVQSIVAGSRRNDLVRTLVEELMFDDEGVFSQFGVYDWAGADEATRQTFWDFAQEQDKTAIEKVTIDGKEAYHISCWIDGVKMSAYVNRAMFEGLSSLFGKNRNAGWETIGKIGSKFTAPMKGMITGYNPTFALKNFLRDQQTALANTNNGVAYMAYVAKAAAKIASNDDDWVRFQALGGVSANETRVDGGFAKAMAPKNIVSRAWNKGKEIIGLPGEISESVSRFAEYLGTLDRLGGNTYENQLAAIRDAAEVTVDFGRHGSVGRLINMWVPYWNANVQGLDKAIRNIKDQPDFIHKVARLGRAMVVNAIPMAIQIALIRHFKREKDYEELSDQVKDNYYCMPIPGKEHKFFKFPKTQDWAVFFSTPILRMWEGVEGRDDKNESWLEAMCSGMDGYFESAVVPQLPFDTRTVLGVENVPVLMPLGLDWMLELAENKNWAGSAIIPYNLQKVSAREQYDEATSWLAYQFGQIFGASPMQIDYILDDYMGNFWGVAAKSIPIMNPLASRGLYSGELSWREKNADILQSLASPFITDNRYSNGTMANYYEMVDQLEQEVLDAGAHGDEKTAEHYAIYKALTQTGGYIDQIRALTTEARGMLKGEEQAGIRWDAVGLAAEAMEFVQKSLDGEIQDPILWMTYHKYGDRIMAEAEALKKYESSNDGDFNFSGALGNPKTIYNRSGDVDVKYDLKDNLEAQDMYSQLRAEEYRKQLDIVISSPEYKSLKPTEKAARLEAAKKVALKRADERMLQYLQQNKIQGETIGKADYDTERREAAYSVAWLLGEQNAYKPALTNAFVDLYDYKDQYSFMPADSTKKTFKDPTDDTGSRVYVLNSAQQRRYSEIYHDTITELYDTVMATEEYKAAGTELRAAMLARAKSYYANDLIKERFAEYLTDSGAVTTTVDKASTEISLEAKYAIQRALGDNNAMSKDVTDELVRLYQYSDVGEVEYFPITTAPKSYADDQHKGQMWVFTEDQRETYMSIMFDIYQRNVRKVMASRQYQQATDYQKAQMLCEVRARLSGETQAEFKHWLRTTKVPTVSKKSPEAQAIQKDIDAAAKVVDGILGKYRTYKQFSEGRGYTQPKKKKKK